MLDVVGNGCDRGCTRRCSLFRKTDYRPGMARTEPVRSNGRQVLRPRIFHKFWNSFTKIVNISCCLAGLRGAITCSISGTITSVWADRRAICMELFLWLTYCGSVTLRANWTTAHALTMQGTLRDSPPYQIARPALERIVTINRCPRSLAVATLFNLWLIVVQLFTKKRGV